MAKAARRATLYTDTGKTNKAGAKTLTRGTNNRPPQTDLKGRAIDIHVGQFYVANMPDFGRKNEAYVEITAITSKGKSNVAHSFKLRVDVRDKSFSAMMAGREILTDVAIIGNGLEFQCRLTEIDKINQEQFDAIKGFVDDNDIPGQAAILLRAAGLPFNPKAVVKTLFGAVTLLDTLNDDDRIWAEFPKLDLRSTAKYKLFEGSYALVQDPRKGGKNPIRLLEYGGELYKSYKSDSDNVPFVRQNYLTLNVLAT